MREGLTSSTMKVPMRPIMQALEFHVSAILVKPANGGLNLGTTFGTSTCTTNQVNNESDYYPNEDPKHDLNYLIS